MGKSNSKLVEDLVPWGGTHPKWSRALPPPKLTKKQKKKERKKETTGRRKDGNKKRRTRKAFVPRLVSS